MEAALAGSRLQDRCADLPCHWHVVAIYGPFVSCPKNTRECFSSFLFREKSLSSIWLVVHRLFKMASYDHEKTAGTSHVEQIQENREPCMSVGQYLATRIPTLKPPMTKVANPISLLATLNRSQWLFFLVRRTSVKVLE